MRGAIFLAITGIALAQSSQQLAEIGDLHLENGQTISNCRVGYRTFGNLNPQKSNAVLFPTWFSGRSEDLAGLIGPGKLVDSSKFYVIAVDALGDGVTSSPSNGQKPFPSFTIRDMVNSQYLLLTKRLGIQHLHAVVGISMGGMQTFEWITAYPTFMDRAVPIIGSPKLTSTDLLLWQAELSAIESAEKCHCDPKLAMETVNAIHQFALYTPEYRAMATPPAEFPKFKATLAVSRMAPEDWASQLRAMMAMDVAKGGTLEAAAQKVKAQALVVVSRQDHMVNPIPAMRFADRIKARTLELTGNCGHMATSCEAAIMNSSVGEFLEAR
jgi:homoserine O-acetyltransferase